MGALQFCCHDQRSAQRSLDLLKKVCVSLQEFFQTLTDPSNEKEDVEIWKTWFGMRRGIVAEGGTQRSRSRQVKR